MIRQRLMLSLVTTVLLGTALFVSPGCGGGNNDSGTTSSGPVAVFTPDVPAPGPGTIVLLPGTVTGANFNVRVAVTGVNSFFGAAFRVQYDTTSLLFNGMTNTSSFLRDGVVPEGNLLFSENHTSVPGEVIVTATRLDPTVAPPVDVTATADLVVLNFTARKVILPAAVNGRLDFVDPREVCDGTVVGAGCGTIAVTWSGGGVAAQ
jgi:hypothetical protein